MQNSLRSKLIDGHTTFGMWVTLDCPTVTEVAPWPRWPSVETNFLDRARLNTPEERHVNSSRFAMNIHCGTHMDAPFHFLDEGRTIDQVPLKSTHGWATLVDLPGKVLGTHLVREELAPWAESLRATAKAILRTGWSSRWMQHDYFTEYPDITTDAAEFLVECGVHLVGVETGSLDFHPNETHIVMLGNDVLIIECLTHLVMDIPTSTIAEGKIKVARSKGESLPEEMLQFLKCFSWIAPPCG